MLSLKSAAFCPRWCRSASSKAAKTYPRVKVNSKGAEGIPKYQHPWVFAGALAAKPPPSVAAGSVIDLVDSRNHFLCRGTYSPDSRMAVRVLTYDEEEKIDGAFWRRRIASSLERRKALPSLTASRTNAYRVINAESDFLPGLVVDKYAEWYTMQIQNAGMEYHREQVIDALADVLKPKGGIYERSDEANRQKDGLPFRKGLVYPPGGQLSAENGGLIQIEECGRKMLVDLAKGHKTGFYLDQRENRNIVGELCNGKRVLNCFSYTGAFSVAALQNGARHVTNVDSSADALRLSKANFELNGFTDTTLYSHVEADVFEYLREPSSKTDKFDLIILDPPKFAASASSIETASRGYKDINRLAMRLLNPGGILATFSCSGAVDQTLFRQIVSSAAIEANRQAQVLQTFSQPADHPVSLAFPEGTYLKGFVVRVL